MTRLFYKVKIEFADGKVLPYNFGSKYEAMTFIEEVTSKLNVKEVGWSIDHLMSRKEAFNEVQQLNAEDF
jgi:hypothetical protein